MAGLIVFKSLADALRAGYQVYDRTADGYLVRTRTAAGWAMALVSCRVTVFILRSIAESKNSRRPVSTGGSFFSA